MLLNEGRVGETVLLQPASIDEMLTPGPVQSPQDFEWGLGFHSLPGEPTWGHRGADLGVAAAAFFDRTAGVGALAFCNSQTSDMNTGDQMAQIVIRLFDEFR